MIEGVERLAAYGDRAIRFARELRPRPACPDIPGSKVFCDAPVLVLICAKAGNGETPFDCCRAGQNLMLGAHGRGLGSCWLGAPIPWLESPGVAVELRLTRGFVPAVAIVLGHAAESPTGKPRPEPLVAWCNDREGREG